MATGKYKRKKQHAQRVAQQTTKRGVVMEQKKTAEKKTETAAKTKNETAEDNEGPTPSRWQRLKNWVSHSREWLIVFFTAVLAVAAIYQFTITDRQLDVMQEDERAWIGVKLQGVGDLAVNVAPSAVISVNNTGKTPAISYTGRFDVAVFPNGPDPQFENRPGVHIRMRTGIVFPNSPVEVPVIRIKPKSGGALNEGEPLPLTEEEMAALNDGKSWIAVYGDIRYRDVFHTDHWTRFCYWKGLKPGITYYSEACPAYNSIDDKE